MGQNTKSYELITFAAFLVGLPGFEPGMTGPESVVLPLHHSPMIFVCGCKDTNKLGIANNSAIFFAKKLILSLRIKASPLKNTKIKS